MNSTDYIQNRYLNQLKWLSDNAEKNQRYYRFLRVITLLCAIAIPFLTGYVTDQREWLKILIGALGVKIAFCEGILSLYKFHDNWITYRTAVNTLEREKVLYDTNSGAYVGLSADDAFRLFVINVENGLSNEHKNWEKQMTEKEEKSV